MKELGKKFVRRPECVRSQAPELSTRKTLSRFKDDKRKPDQKTVPNKGDQEIIMAGRKRRPDKQKAPVRADKIQRRREFRNLSRFKDDKRKPDQETVAAPGKDVKGKACQGQRLPRDHAVDGRARQAVRRCSYRLSLVFIGSYLSRNFRHPACPGSVCKIARRFQVFVVRLLEAKHVPIRAILSRHLSEFGFNRLAASAHVP